MTEKTNETVLLEMIDNLVCFKVNRLYKRLDRVSYLKPSEYVGGQLDAWLWFAWNVASGDCSVQDALDIVLDDINYYSSGERRYYYRSKGIVSASMDIYDSMKRFTQTYYDNAETPIRHILSTVYFDCFNFNMRFNPLMKVGC